MNSDTKELITVGTEFLDYALQNQQYDGLNKVGQQCYVQCGICQKTSNRAHPLCFQHYLKNNNGTIHLMWRSKYPVGCSHENYDGEPWCNGCWTIVDNKPACFDCVKCYWGTLKMTKQNKTYKFMWIDKTESCMNELIQLSELIQKYKIE